MFKSLINSSFDVFLTEAIISGFICTPQNVQISDDENNEECIHLFLVSKGLKNYTFFVKFDKN